MSECVMTGFAWWGIAITVVWFIWVNYKCASVTAIDKAQDAWISEICKLRNEIAELKKGKRK